MRSKEYYTRCYSELLEMSGLIDTDWRRELLKKMVDRKMMEDELIEALEPGYTEDDMVEIDDEDEDDEQDVEDEKDGYDEYDEDDEDMMEEIDTPE